MREIHSSHIIATIRQLCILANRSLPPDVRQALERAIEQEESPLGRDILRDIVKNADIARGEDMPICQDTGMAIVFLEIGQEVHISGGDLYEAVNEGVRQGYRDGYLRKSSVADPFLTRKNTGDNTPAVIHTTIVPGDKLRVIVAPKGGGSENMSGLTMLTPAQGAAGVKKFVVDLVDKAGANPCPPIIVGVGVGGSMEKTALLAKQALLRPVGQPNPDPQIAAVEAELLAEINALGVGPQGFGGRITALAVHIETFPAHIATLPVAVNIQCHAARHQEAII